jgi:hypothetical protein
VLIHTFERAVTLLFQVQAIIDRTIPTPVNEEDTAALKKAADHSYREFMGIAPTTEEGQPLSYCEQVAQALFNLSLTLDVLHTAQIAEKKQHSRSLGSLFGETIRLAKEGVSDALKDGDRSIRLWWNEVKGQDGDRKAVKVG